MMPRVLQAQVHAPQHAGVGFVTQSRRLGRRALALVKGGNTEHGSRAHAVQIQRGVEVRCFHQQVVAARLGSDEQPRPGGRTAAEMVDEFPEDPVRDARQQGRLLEGFRLGREIVVMGNVLAPGAVLLLQQPADIQVIILQGDERLLVDPVRDQAVLAAHAAALHGIDLPGQRGAMARVIVDLRLHRRRIDLFHGVARAGQQEALPHAAREDLRPAGQPGEGLVRGDGPYAELPEVSGIDSAGRQLRERVEIGLSGIDRSVLDGLMRGRHRNDRKC